MACTNTQLLWYPNLQLPSQYCDSMAISSFYQRCGCRCDYLSSLHPSVIITYAIEAGNRIICLFLNPNESFEGESSKRKRHPARSVSPVNCCFTSSNGGRDGSDINSLNRSSVSARARQIVRCNTTVQHCRRRKNHAVSLTNDAHRRKQQNCSEGR